MTLTSAYLYLAGAIGFEIAATCAMKLTESFTRPLPSLGVAAGYAVSFYLMSQTIKLIPVGLAYAIWSGVGIVAVSVFCRIFYRQILDTPAMLGMGLIITGVVVINLFSKSVGGGA